MGRERLGRVHPALKRESVLFEDYVGELAKNAEKVLRRHGKDIAEMQFTQRRLADMAIDLYAMVAVLSRATAALEARGEEGAAQELELAVAFCNQAGHRLKRDVRGFDDNDDEARKSIADKAYASGGYDV
jgi:acyl-CoA dehydrogenase family protein 9